MPDPTAEAAALLRNAFLRTGSEPTMGNQPNGPEQEVPPTTSDYLAHRLDGARDLYLLALALGERPNGVPTFGPMIREARIHFTGVIEEARIAGLDTNAIAAILGKSNVELADGGIRPELRERVQQLLADVRRR